MEWNVFVILGSSQEIVCSEVVDSQQKKDDPGPLLSEVDRIVNACTQLSAEDRWRVLASLASELTKTEEKKLAYLLASRQRKKIKDEVHRMKPSDYGIENLLNLDLYDYVHTKNQILISFLEGLAGDVDKNDMTKLYCLGRTVEQIYKLSTWSRTKVQPLSFFSNLCTYLDTCSKLTVDCDGCIAPSGKYTSITSWMLEQAAAGAPSAPEGDLGVAFDNNQVLGKRWQVSPLVKSQSSVITNKMFVQLESDGVLQKNEMMKPGQWFTLENIKSHVAQNKDTVTSEEKDMYEKAHEEQKKHFMNAAIKELLTEFDDSHDPIDTIITQRQSNRLRKKCCACNMYCSSGKQKCVFCGANFVKPQGKTPQDDIPVLTDLHSSSEKTASSVKRICPEKGEYIIIVRILYVIRLSVQF